MKWRLYQARITLVEPLLGTVPKNKEVYSRFIQAKAAAEIDDELATVEELEEIGWTGFHRDSNGLFLFDYQLLGYLKEAGNILKSQLGVANLRNKVAMYVYPEPRRIYLGRHEPDGCIERPLRGQTMQGERVTVVRSDFVAPGTSVAFRLRILEHKEVTPDLVRTLLEFGAVRGMGRWRGGGYGRFQLVQWRLVTAVGFEGSEAAQ